MYEYTVLLVMVDEVVLSTISDIYTKLDGKKRNMCALQVSSDVMCHNCIPKNLVSMILLAISEKYYLL
jgi:hypothetical protein